MAQAVGVTKQAVCQFLEALPRIDKPAAQEDAQAVGVTLLIRRYVFLVNWKTCKITRNPPRGTRSPRPWGVRKLKWRKVFQTATFPIPIKPPLRGTSIEVAFLQIGKLARMQQTRGGPRALMQF